MSRVLAFVAKQWPCFAKFCWLTVLVAAISLKILSVLRSFYTSVKNMRAVVRMETLFWNVPGRVLPSRWCRSANVSILWTAPREKADLALIDSFDQIRTDFVEQCSILFQIKHSSRRRKPIGVVTLSRFKVTKNSERTNEDVFQFLFELRYEFYIESV